MEKNKDCLISVIMSVYNAEDYLVDAIESILNQTYEDWEFIICNDGSTDGTQKILNQYKEKFPDKFVLLQNDSNKFLPYSLNRCIEAANGEYIARMDGDDKSVPDRFEKQIRFLQEHPEYDLVGAAMQRFDEKKLADLVKKPADVDRNFIRNDVPFNHATIMTYKRVYEALGGYTVSPRTVRGQDYDLWFRFFYKGFRGYNLQEPLYLVRENMAAIKRRTFKVRWNAFKTTCIGYKLLGFPRRWLVKPFCLAIGKSLVPYGLIKKYREYQGRKAAE